MSLIIKTPATAEALSLADAKAHLRLETTFTTDDAYISALIKAAAYQAETFTNRSLMLKTYQLIEDGFQPEARRVRFSASQFQVPGDPGRLNLWREAQIILPVPLVSVISVIYIDTDGAAKTWPAANYLVDKESEPARITPAYGVSWPSSRAQVKAVTFEFTAGYADAATVPEGIKQAMKFLVAHWYEERQIIRQGQFAHVPKAFEFLLLPFTVFRFA